ncbi:MAG TPA: hypothetical protein VM529_03860 [Gemmata sp.]|nr:hypothetical protein [Gemmata sp.]
MSGYAEDSSPSPRPVGPRDVELARAAAVAPGTFLILNGLLGLVFLGLLSVPFVFNPEGFLDAAERMIAQEPPGPEKQQVEQDIADARQQLADPAQRNVIVFRAGVSLGIPAVVNVLAIAGGLSLRRLGSYRLAAAGSIASLIPLATGCCVTGIPFGIWGLATLARPEVRAAFAARRDAPPEDPDAQYLR